MIVWAFCLSIFYLFHNYPDFVWLLPLVPDATAALSLYRMRMAQAKKAKHPTAWRGK